MNRIATSCAGLRFKRLRLSGSTGACIQLVNWNGGARPDAAAPRCALPASSAVESACSPGVRFCGAEGVVYRNPARASGRVYCHREPVRFQGNANVRAETTTKRLACPYDLAARGSREIATAGFSAGGCGALFHVYLCAMRERIHQGRRPGRSG